MTSRTLKLLTASTAFAAAASVGNAVSDTVTISYTTPIQTSNTTAGVVSIQGGANVIVTAGAAVQISNTSHGASTDAGVNIDTGSRIESDHAAGTILLADDTASLDTVSIVNSGTIINTATNGTAIRIDEQNEAGNDIAVEITNNRTISGSVVVGDGGLTYVGNNATQNGSITAGSGADEVTLNGGSMTGNINLGDGANELNVNGATLTGNYTGGAGADIVTLNNATVTGDLNGGGAADQLIINGSRTFTTGGTISAFETVNFKTNTVLNHSLSGATTTTVDAGKSVTANAAANFGALTNNGTLTIAAGESVDVTTYAGTGTVGINVGSSNTADVGLLKVNSGVLATGTSVTINVASNAGFIANGTSYTIATGNNAHGDVSLTSTANGVYRYSAADNGNDELVLTINRVSTSSVVEGADNKAAANVLDALGAGAKGELATLQGVIGSQSNAAGVQQVLESLTPSIDGAGVASVNFAVDTGNQVSNRLASVRGNGYGVATGDAMSSRHMWAQGFGSTVKQDDKGGARGYDADSTGASIGIDTDTLVDGVTTGIAVTYGKSTVDSNAAGNASTDIDTYAATLYGSRVMDNGVFVNGQLGAGYNKYEMERNIAGVGQTKGDTDGLQASAKLETGKDFAFGGATLTPLASLQYTYLDMDSYTETGAGGASLRVNPDAMSTVDAGVGGEASYAIPLSDGGTLKPSVRAKYVYRMGDDSMATTSQFVGGGTAFDTNGIKADRSSVNLGAGLLLTTVGGTDVSLNYDADIRSSLTGHTGQVKARWAF